MTEGIKVQITGESALAAIKEIVKNGGRDFSAIFPETAFALFDSAKKIEGTWKNYAMGYPSSDYPHLGIKDIPRPDPKLADSVKTSPNTPGKLEYTVHSDHPLMSDYQNGKDETIDMKAPNSPWLKGKKSRLNKKDGSPYLIVPFSWGTGTGHFRNVVPAGIQKAMTRRALSRNLGKLHTEPNANGEEIWRDDYNWGGRISPEEAEQAGNDRLSGMVRMEDSAYKNGNHGTYFTFRVISAKSAADKWIQHRKIEARDITGALKREFEQYITEVVREGFYADMKPII